MSENYEVEATVTLVVRREMNAEDHRDCKRKIRDDLIREGFRKVKVTYIETKVMDDDELFIDFTV